jgi:hypothetical protein
VFLPIGPIINKNVENMLDSTKFITVDEVWSSLEPIGSRINSVHAKH